MSLPFPTMMLQTLVENAINPVSSCLRVRRGYDLDPGGGQERPRGHHRGRRRDRAGAQTTGGGIGLKDCGNDWNSLAADAAFDLTPSFRPGRPAAITVPTAGPREVARLPRPYRPCWPRTKRSSRCARRMFREEWPALEIVATCEDGGAALEAIGEHRPGVRVLRHPASPASPDSRWRRRRPKPAPHAGRVRHRLRISSRSRRSSAGAVDYLLKPVSAQRWWPRSTGCRHQRHVTRGRRDAGRTDEGTGGSRCRPAGPPNPPLASITASAGKETRLIIVRGRRRLLQVRQQVPDGDDGAGRSAAAHAAARTAREAHATNFKQIHRSTIVNMRMVAAVVRDESGRGTMRLKNRPRRWP